MTLKEMEQNIQENINKFNDLPKNLVKTETNVMGLRSIYCSVFKK